MCAYCMVGDFMFRHDPPWNPPYPTSVPTPLVQTPVNPWDLGKLVEFHDLLKRVKELEDKLGCPCEQNKADYIGMLKERIETLEKKVALP